MIRHDSINGYIFGQEGSIPSAARTRWPLHKAPSTAYLLVQQENQFVFSTVARN